jgi:hypothetical protein
MAPFVIFGHDCSASHIANLPGIVNELQCGRSEGCNGDTSDIRPTCRPDGRERRHPSRRWRACCPMSEPVHPVDQILPYPKLGALGLQHVLVMYANAVAVPLIIGGALHLPKGSDRDADQRRLVRLRNSDADPDRRLRPVRHPFADHHGRDRGVDLADAGDGGDAGRRTDRNLRRRSGRRHFRPVRRAVRQIRAALLSRGGDRHDHHHDRRGADAGRRQLGRRRRRQGGLRRGRLSAGRRAGARSSSCW